MTVEGNHATTISPALNLTGGLCASERRLIICFTCSPSSSQCLYLLYLVELVYCLLHHTNRVRRSCPRAPSQGYNKTTSDSYPPRSIERHTYWWRRTSDYEVCASPSRKYQVNCRHGVERDRFARLAGQSTNIHTPGHST